MKRFRGAIAVFLGAASFGILSTFVKKAYEAGFTLAEVTGVQALMGMVFLWMLHVVTHKTNQQKKAENDKKTAKWKLIIAGFSSGLVSILYYKCVQLVPASIAIVLLMQFIWISAILDFLIYRQRPTSVQIIGMIGVLGATLLATGVLEASIMQLDTVGVIYGLLAATAYALFILVSGKVGNDYPPVQKSALMITGACILIFVLFQPFHLLTLSVDTRIFYFGLLLSLFGTVLPPLLFAYGIPKIGVSMGGILSAVELPVAVGMSYMVLQEKVSTLQWIGVIVILAIVVWINVSRKNKKATD